MPPEEPVIFEAKYEGRCGLCQGEIELEDLIVKVDDEYCHVICAEDHGYI